MYHMLPAIQMQQQRVRESSDATPISGSLSSASGMASCRESRESVATQDVRSSTGFVRR